MPYLGTAPASALLETGDIADAAITLAKMASGSANNIIKYDGSGNPSSASGGKVLQVVEGTLTSTFTTTSTSYVGSGLDVAITPASSSNKVLIIASAFIRQDGDGSGTATTSDAELRKGGSTVSATVRQDGFDNNASVSDDKTWGSLAINHLSSPSTTSATTYEIYVKGASASAKIDHGSIIAMEISA